MKIELEEDDLYNTDSTIAQFCIDIITKFRDKKQGIPAINVVDIPVRVELEADELNFHSVENNGAQFVHSEKAYNAILEDIIKAFELVLDDVNYGFGQNQKSREIERGLQLFSKYFHTLWI